MHLTSSASVAVVALVALVNPIAEEFLHLGFLANVLRNEGPMFAVGASVLVRQATHLYQGPIGVLSILPLGILFGAFYIRTGRLWPIVIAHGLLDILGVVALRAA